MRFEFPATWPPAILVVGSLCTPRDRAGGKGPLSRRDAVAKLPIWGLTCGYFRGLWTEKSKLYARILVSQGPSGTYGVGWMRRRGRVPDGLPDRSPDAARNATGATFKFAGH